MRRFEIALASVLLLGSLAPATAGISLPIRRLELCLRNGASLSTSQQWALQSEVKSIWARYGVDITWRDDRAGIDGQESVLIVNVSDEALAGHGGQAADPHTLGAVGFSPQRGTFGRTIFVSPRSARWVVTSPANASTIDGVLGRVLGRVVAHELGHIILGMPDHTSAGLMKIRFEPVDLLASGINHLELDQRALETLASRPQITPGYAADAVVTSSRR